MDLLLYGLIVVLAACLAVCCWRHHRQYRRLVRRINDCHPHWKR